MTPVMQTICDRGKGDCLRACVASLLELEIEQVPHFIRYNNWHASFIYFLASFGIQFNGTGRLSKLRFPEVSDTISGLVIAVVPSLNFEKMTHVVLMDIRGNVVHDPSPKLSYNGHNIIESNTLSSWSLLQENVDRPFIPSEKLTIRDIFQPN